jgi:hypothetical protein
MLKIDYKLLRITAWHCKDHPSIITDFMQINSGKKNTFLELFSGYGHISKKAALLGYKTFSLDINPKLNPTLSVDIRKVKLSQLPGEVKYIWASIPCTVFSIMSIEKHWEKIPYSWRKYYYVPKTPEAKEALQIVEKTLWIIKKLNPDYYFIENPRGALRHLPQIRFIPFLHTVSYYDYGFNYYKPTDIFTNFPNLKLKKLTAKENINCTGKLTHLNSAQERSIIPGQLIDEILNQLP